jgi:hypothetical protein
VTDEHQIGCVLKLESAMEYQKANILIPHMLEFFDGRVCRQFKEYRDWDSEIKRESASTSLRHMG